MGLASYDTTAPRPVSFSPTMIALSDISLATGAISSVDQIATFKSFKSLNLGSGRSSFQPTDSSPNGPDIISKAILKSSALLAKGPQTDKSGSGTLATNS